MRSSRAALAALLLFLGLASPALAEQQLQQRQEASAVKLASFVLLLTAYLGLNSSLNLLNRWSLGVYGLRFPLLLTSCHMAFSFVALGPIALQRSRRADKAQHKPLAQQWKGLAFIGASMAFSIALNNLSLQDISLTLNQIIRSATPVMTCALAAVVQQQRPTRKEVSALLLLTLGVMLAMWQGSVAGKPYAIMFCLGSVVCTGTMLTFSSRVLSEKLDVMQLTLYTAPISLLCLAPVALAIELRPFLEYLPTHRSAVALIVGASSVNAVTYNLVHYLMIQRTSAVTTTVIGEAKVVGLLALSAVVLGEGREMTARMAAGLIFSMLGFGFYSHAKILQARRFAAPSPAPSQATDGGSAGAAAAELTPLLQAVVHSAPGSAGDTKHSQ